MPLENFGSILNFAEELESQDQEFYEAAARKCHRNDPGTD